MPTLTANGTATCNRLTPGFGSLYCAVFCFARCFALRVDLPALRSLGQWFGPAARANPNMGSSGCRCRMRRLRRTDVRLQVKTVTRFGNKFPANHRFPLLSRASLALRRLHRHPTTVRTGWYRFPRSSMHLCLARLSPTTWGGVAPGVLSRHPSAPEIGLPRRSWLHLLPVQKVERKEWPNGLARLDGQ